MNADEFIKYLPTETNNLKLVSISEVRSNEVKVDKISELENSILHVYFGVFAGLLFASIAILLTLPKIYKRQLKTINNTVETAPQIPCKTCRFFDRNPYLKCTVRPSTVLTPEAIDCSDYCRYD